MPLLKESAVRFHARLACVDVPVICVWRTFHFFVWNSFLILESRGFYAVSN